MRSMEALLNNWMSHIEMIETEDIFEKDSIYFNIKIMEIVLNLNTNPIQFLEMFVKLKPMSNIKMLERYQVSKTQNIIN